MDDARFIERINRILAAGRLRLPPLAAPQDEDGEAVARWAEFLGACVRSGISLRDPRWARVRVVRERPHTVLELDAEGTDRPDDRDLRVGLRLLIGMLERDADGT